MLKIKKIICLYLYNLINECKREIKEIKSREKVKSLYKQDWDL